MKLSAATLLAIVATAPGMAFGQDGSAVADPRAIEFCDSIADSVPVSECLPDAHVAVRLLDGFDALYPPEAQPLRAWCNERNENPNSAGLCVLTAIESAVEQWRNLEEGLNLDDPVLAAVSDPALLDELQAIQLEARAAFPDRTLWGGGMYVPYE
jgi:hypothetical protein